MKVRSVEELADRLADDLKARKREMASVKAMIGGARDHEKECLLRAGFVLLYAHLEGFVKMAGTAYLALVRHQGLSYDQLKPNFVAAALKSKLETLGEVGKATVVTTVVRQLIYSAKDKAELVWSGEIDCRHNLTSEVLGEITCLLGLEFARYETRRHFLDDSLLFNRNGIAHGQLVKIDEATFRDAHDKVAQLLELFRADIENAAATEAFREASTI